MTTDPKPGMTLVIYPLRQKAVQARCSITSSLTSIRMSVHVSLCLSPPVCAFQLQSGSCSSPERIPSCANTRSSPS